VLSLSGDTPILSNHNSPVTGAISHELASLVTQISIIGPQLRMHQPAVRYP
jgi:hypothetical protein